MKKIIYLVTFIMVVGIYSVSAEYKSDWAAESIELAKSYNMLPDELTDCDFTLPVTRNEIAELITNAHTNIIGGAASSINTPFSDVGGSHISTVYELGVMNGKSETKFAPYEIKSAAEIGVRLGSTWIPQEDIQDFVHELLGTPFYMRRLIEVKFIPQTSQWVITNKTRDRGNVKAATTYGTHRINGYEIIEESLNLKDVRIFDYPIRQRLIL